MRAKKLGAWSLSIVVAAGLFGGSAADPEVRTVATKLTGVAKDPNAGDPDGRGEITITLDRERSQVCFDMSVTDIAPATGVTIHEGPKEIGEGPVLLSLTPPVSGTSAGCLSVGPNVLEKILKNPADFYVSVENSEFPRGALRGQLVE